MPASLRISSADISRTARALSAAGALCLISSFASVDQFLFRHIALPRLEVLAQFLDQIARLHFPDLVAVVLHLAGRRNVVGAARARNAMDVHADSFQE